MVTASNRLTGYLRTRSPVPVLMRVQPQSWIVPVTIRSAVPRDCIQARLSTEEQLMYRLIFSFPRIRAASKGQKGDGGCVRTGLARARLDSSRHVGGTRLGDPRRLRPGPSSDV